MEAILARATVPILRRVKARPRELATALLPNLVRTMPHDVRGNGRGATTPERLAKLMARFSEMAYRASPTTGISWNHPFPSGTRIHSRQNPIEPDLFLELDGNHLKSLASQVLGQVFNGVEIRDVSSLRGAFFCFSVRIREPEMDVVQEHPDAGRMAVHDGLLVRSVANPQHAHAVVLHLHFVMLRVDADRVVGHRSSSVHESPQV